MTPTTTLVPNEAATTMRAVFEKELSAVFEKLAAAAAVDADAAVERARATSQAALDETLTELQDQIRQKEGLIESVLQLEIQVEELQSKVQDASGQQKTAEAAYEREHAARLRAEETSARLLEALKSVQQACALAEPSGDKPTRRKGESARAARERASETSDDGGTSKNEVDRSTDGDATASSATVSGRNLTLVATNDPASDAPPELVEYVKQLFEQIDAMYTAEQQVHGSDELVDHLRANLRYARDVFERRVSSEGGAGRRLFEQELSARLDAHAATPLGRHLAVAAYELAEEPSARAEAS